MSRAIKAAHYWLSHKKPLDGSQVTIVDIGVAASRRTAVGHHVADAAEITVGDQDTLAAVWVCGGSTVDAFAVPDEQVDCLGCRLAAAVPAGPVVYFAWGEDDELLYVGSSVKVAQRIRGHVAQTHWWSEVRRLTFEEYPTEQDARRAESDAIYARPGTYNSDSRRPGRKASHDALLKLIDGGAAS